MQAYLNKPVKQEVQLRAIRDYVRARTTVRHGADGSEEKASRAARGLAERTPAYLENCRRDVIVMLAALDRADFDAVTIRGPNLLGSRGGFGLPAITDFWGPESSRPPGRRRRGDPPVGGRAIELSRSCLDRSVQVLA